MFLLSMFTFQVSNTFGTLTVSSCSLYQFEVHYVYVATGTHLMMYQKLMFLIGLRERLRRLASLI